MLNQIMDSLSLVDKAALTYSCAWLYHKTGGVYLQELSQPQNWNAKLEFLDRLWTSFPKHKLCVGCAKHHLKTSAGPRFPVNIPGYCAIGWKYVSENMSSVHIRSGEVPVPKTFNDWCCGAKWTVYHGEKHDGTRDQESRMIIITYERPLTLALLHETVITDLPSCIHILGQVQLREICKVLIAGTPRPWQLDLRQSEQKSEVYRCYRCPSEFQLSVKPYSNAKKSNIAEASHMLQVVHVIDLGPCYTAHDRCWSALTTKGSSTTTSTDPFPLTMSNPLIYHALGRPSFHDNSYKVVALTH